MKKEKKGILFFLIMALAGVVIRILYKTLPETLEADSAVFALMAKYISGLKEFPVYLWLCHYAGCLCSYIGAVIFRIFGVSAAAFNFVGVIFSVIWMILAAILLRKALDRPGYIPAILLVVLPPFNVLLYSMYPGIPAETLIFGSIIFLLLVRYMDESPVGPAVYALLGVSSGIGMWLSPGILPFVLTVFTVFLIKDRKVFFSRAMAVFVLSFIAGYLPAIIYNIQYPGASLMRIAGRLLDLDRSVLGSPDLIRIVAGRILRRLSSMPVFLMRIPVLVYSLTGVINAVLFFAALAWTARKSFTGFLRDKKTDAVGISLIFVFWFAAFYVILSGENRIRYMISLYVAAPLLIGKLLSDINTMSRLVYGALVAAILLYNGYDIGSSFLNRRYAHYSELAKRLEGKNIRYGYSDYDTAYLVTFDSDEKVLISPTLFHPTFSDRRPEYTGKVRNSGNAAYIIRTSAYPRAAAEIAAGLRMLGVKFKKDVMEDFIIYYGLTRRVYPEELRGVLHEV